jgi:hypothetical protein
MHQIVPPPCLADLIHVKVPVIARGTVRAMTETVTVSPELLRRFDVSGPATRHTPLPTGLSKRFGEVRLRPGAGAAAPAGPAALALPLSLYVHIPFCESLCYYCACNKIITKHHEKAAEYLRYLSRDRPARGALGPGQAVSASCTWAAARPPSCPTTNCAN